MDGQWRDSDGMPSRLTGLPPVRSRWYGYGRIDAAAAVRAALDYVPFTDLVIRDDLADLGNVPSMGGFFDTPDVWCRRLPPGSDTGALPANYATAGPHENPLRGQSNWLYARVHNKGTRPRSMPGCAFRSRTFRAWSSPIRHRSCRGVGPEEMLPNPLTLATHFIGEAKVSAVPPGGEQIVRVEWRAELIPPEQVPTPAGPLKWHPCLLAEITPHDGPAATGSHVWDYNNLAQKNVTIVDAIPGSEFGMAMMMGAGSNDGDSLLLEVLRGKLSHHVELYLDLFDLPSRRWSSAPPSGNWANGTADGSSSSHRCSRCVCRFRYGPGASHPSSSAASSEPGAGRVYEIQMVQRQARGKVSGAAACRSPSGAEALRRSRAVAFRVRQVFPELGRRPRVRPSITGRRDRGGKVCTDEQSERRAGGQVLERIPCKVPLGRGHLGLPDRGLAAGRRRRAEHLAPLRATRRAWCRTATPATWPATTTGAARTTSR